MSIKFSKRTVQVTMKILLLLAVVLGGTGLLVTPSQTASASNQSEGVWAHAVNACAMNEADLNEYAVGQFLTLQKGIVGKLVAYCSVENLPILGGDELELIYRDPDGRRMGSRVIAKLQQLTNSGEVITLATVDSNAGPASPSFQARSKTFSHNFDFVNNAYYVEVIVSRSDVKLVPAAAIVRIKAFFI